MLYTNGLDLITLAQAPVRAIENAPRPGPPQTSSFGQLVWVRGDFHFVLGGPPTLSGDELRKVAASVK